MHSDALLSLVAQDETSATFAATLEADKHVNPYGLWVALNGFDADDVHRSAGFSAIRWNEQPAPPVGSMCQVTVAKNVDPAHPVVRYEAFVVLQPDVWTPVSATVDL